MLVGVGVGLCVALISAVPVSPHESGVGVGVLVGVGVIANVGTKSMIGASVGGWIVSTGGSGLIRDNTMYPVMQITPKNMSTRRINLKGDEPPLGGKRSRST